MPTIYNSDLSKELQIGASLQVSEGIPNQLAEKVVPVMEVNPKLTKTLDIVKYTNTSGTSNATIYTVPDQEFYLKGAQLSIIKNATSDVATGSYGLLATINGVSTPILSLALLTLTAQEQSICISFINPIKVDKNTSILLASAASTAGTMVRTGIIYGYLKLNS